MKFGQMFVKDNGRLLVAVGCWSRVLMAGGY
jgi:hypothetical protein